jgi:hypothetical protein
MRVNRGLFQRAELVKPGTQRGIKRQAREGPKDIDVQDHAHTERQ